MSENLYEYKATATNAISCYSNLSNYGANGKWRPIVPPSPMTVQPVMFNKLHPHTMPMKMYPLTTKKDRCVPYFTNTDMEENCK